jgi:hypothetical protein
MSKQMDAKKARIEVLKAKENRTTYESRCLANAMYQVENRTLSKVYKNLRREIENEKPSDLKDEILRMLGEYDFPTDRSFVNMAKKGKMKKYWSIWDGLGILEKFNKKSEARKRADKQQAREAKKTMEVVKKAA